MAEGLAKVILKKQGDGDGDRKVFAERLVNRIIERKGLLG